MSIPMSQFISASLYPLITVSLFSSLYEPLRVPICVFVFLAQTGFLTSELCLPSDWEFLQVRSVSPLSDCTSQTGASTPPNR